MVILLFGAVWGCLGLFGWRKRYLFAHLDWKLAGPTVGRDGGGSAPEAARCRVRGLAVSEQREAAQRSQCEARRRSLRRRRSALRLIRLLPLQSNEKRTALRGQQLIAALSGASGASMVA